MDGKLRFMGLLALLQTVSCEFFHEPSAILLKPAGEPNPKSDFGFAVGNWNENLIVGSPSSNFFGEVYKCPITSITNETQISCSVLDLKVNDTSYSRALNPNQNFYLGAAIATTKDYFLTCAPLVTKEFQTSTKTTKNAKIPYKDAFGSCFIYLNNDTVRQYKGPDDRFLQKLDYNKDRIEGGTGWTMLADENNGYLIISKTALIGDINYSHISNPWKATQSLMSGSWIYSNFAAQSNNLGDYWDIGAGLTAGKFFKPTETIYAFSVQSKQMKGKIFFMKQIKKYLTLVFDKNKKPYSIRDTVIGGMFGYALASGDLNMDGLSELLVGAPAQSDDAADVEFGALHIYLGGKEELITDKNRMRTIFGSVEKGRFGTAISTSDVDGDNIPEVFVSAPYEESGVLYVLSGYELNRTLLRPGFKQILVTELKFTQRLTRTENLFGFSIQPIADIDQNGCNDLAVGAPGAASVLLYRCLQTVNVTVTLELNGLQNVKELDNNFTVNVCLQIGYNNNSADVIGNISVKNEIIGVGVVIDDPTFTLDLSEKNETYCKTITIQMTPFEEATYKFVTNVELENLKTTLESKDFDKSWVVLSPYSVTKSELLVVRRCSGDVICLPQLSLDIPWSKSQDYEVGSSETETISVVVKNNGSSAYSACVMIAVTGARVARTECRPQDGEYVCSLPKPLKREAKHLISMVLNMTELSSDDNKLIVNARLYENCNQGNSTLQVLEIGYLFDNASKDVYLDGASHDLLVTDKEIVDEDIKIFKDNHDYLITNKGSVEWKNIKAVIVVEKRSFISVVNTPEGENCDVINGEHQHEIFCNITLPPRCLKKIMAWAELSKTEVGKYLNGGKTINVTSELKLYLKTSDHPHIKQVVTEIKWKKDLSFGNNMFLIILIAIILAILFLVLITYVLYKNDFFKRKQKKRLDVLRETVRRRSIRLASDKSSRQSHKSPSTAEEDHLKDIEVMEDSAFEEVPVGSKDDMVLIESRAEIHNEEPSNSTSK